MADLERNQQVVVDYYQTAFSGDPEKAVADHVGSRYIRHNPDAADGPEAFIGFVHWLRGEYPGLRLDIKRVIAEGDMAVTHCHLDLEPGNAGNPAARSLTSSAWRTAKSSSTGMSSRTCRTTPPTPTACSDRPGSHLADRWQRTGRERLEWPGFPAPGPHVFVARTHALYCRH
jgi:predicted SnoaL-like aldol condensation-catalyzing enzyme